jgi:hypothetical protein
MSTLRNHPDAERLMLGLPALVPMMWDGLDGS